MIWLKKYDGNHGWRSAGGEAPGWTNTFSDEAAPNHPGNASGEIYLNFSPWLRSKTKVQDAWSSPDSSRQRIIR